MYQKNVKKQKFRKKLKNVVQKTRCYAQIIIYSFFSMSHGKLLPITTLLMQKYLPI